MTDDRTRFDNTSDYIKHLAEIIAHRMMKHDTLAAYPATAAASVLLGLQIGLTPKLMSDIILELCEDFERTAREAN